MEELPNVTAEFAKKHVDIRWLSMKLACVRVLERWDNLCEYFVTFLPTHKNFKREILPTMRYKRIKAALENTTTQGYISFCSHIAQDFENFLQTFQANESMVHMLYPEICKLLTNLMSKCIRKNILSQNSQENVGIDVLKVENHKSKKNVEIGVKARLIVGDRNLVSSENQDAFRKSFLKFYSTATKHLLEHLPLNVSVIRHAQFLHPEKRNNSGATNAISNLSLKLTAALENKQFSLVQLFLASMIQKKVSVT